MVQMVALELYANFNCFPVFLGADLKERYYKGEGLWYRPAPSSTPRLASNVLQCTLSEAACVILLHMLRTAHAAAWSF